VRLAFILTSLVLASSVTQANADETNAPSEQTKSIGKPHTCSNYYPIEALILNEQGKTVLAFTVTKEGGTRDIRIDQSSGFAVLDNAAAACASHWKYKPATQDTVPVDLPWKAAVQWVMPSESPFTTMPMVRGDEDACALKPAGTEGIHGETILFFTVKANGKLDDVELERTSGSTALDNFARDCVQKRFYVPATHAGKAIAAEWYARLKW
jgi:TonB family protein